MAITRAIGRIFDAVSPAVGSRARDVWYTLNGGRAASEAAVQDWRFSELKEHLRSLPKATDASFAVHDSFDRLSRLGNSGGSALAVVSVVPPAKTGIANFTAKAFGAAEVPVDVFFPHNGIAEYLAATHRLGSPEQGMRFFSMEALDVGLALRGYKAVVWVLGNSDHHIDVAKLLRTVRHLSSPVPCWIEIHDPVLLNLASKIALFEGCDLAQVLLHPGARNLAGIDWERAKRGDHREIIERGCSGIRALLNDVPLEGLIFHSQAAREFALRDWPDLDPSRAHVLFHPVFDDLEASKPKAIGSHLRIGSFGVPGTHKETDRVLRAFRAIRASHPRATLLLAGYDAGRYARNEGIADEPGIIIEDSPTTERLMSLMRGVDIAVQLRAGNTGESSGIVPQLIALNRIVVASAVGAFVDFGEAVRYVQPGCPPTDLANVILDEVGNYERRAQSRSRYVVAHSPARFCEELVRIIGTGKAIEDAKAYDLEDLMPIVANPSVPQDGHELVGGVACSQAPDLLGSVSVLWADFEQLMRETGEVDNPYIQTHMRRYRHTLAAIEEIMPPSGGSALEVGTSWLFALLLRTKLGFDRVDVTDFKSDDDRNNIPVDLCYPSFTGRINAFNVNLEADVLPTDDDQYDLILCCEVLEHMDVDPMFMLSELNRVMRVGGRLLITTPNVTSSRNVTKMLKGYAPHFFMQYIKDRSPYRHNIEYAPDQVAALVTASGFRIDRLWTADSFEEPSPEAIEALARLGYPTGNRGDNMFVIATKEGAVRERHPAAIYV